jgi:hypothetical protein
MLKKVTVIAAIVCAACFLTLIVVILSVSLAFGRTNLELSASAERIDTTHAIELKPRNKKVIRNIVIYPGNFIDASQYLAFGQTLMERLQAEVIIARPGLRLSAFTQPYLQLDPDADQRLPWTLIGHSAGSAAACKYAGGDKPAKLIIIDGYCRTQPQTDMRTYVGSRDKLLFLAPSASKKAAVHIPGGDHFLPVNCNRYTPAFAQLINDITAQY